MVTEKYAQQIAFATFLEMYEKEDAHEGRELVELSVVGFLDAYDKIKNEFAAILQERLKQGIQSYSIEARNKFIEVWALLRDSESKANRPAIIGGVFGIILGWIEYVGSSKEFSKALENINQHDIDEMVGIIKSIVLILKRIDPSITFKHFAEAITSIAAKKKSQLSKPQLVFILSIANKFPVSSGNMAFQH